MKLPVIEVEPRKKIITSSKWKKKELADFHLEALLYCGFGCSYCSSNSSMHLKMRKRSLNEAVLRETGQAFDPHHSSSLTITYEGLVPALAQELDTAKRKPGAGRTLVYSQLTDGFSPHLINTGIPEEILRLLIQKTSFRIRILTKNAIIGNSKWVKFFAAHPDRFVVGLSIGTLDAKFTQKMEQGTSSPQARLKALRDLQDAGVPTYGMMCPVFPQVVNSDELERLIESIRPDRCEHV